MSESPQIVTFYSYKGGVGRSMAVLNVAYALADQGHNVLVLDMDLEAPGLSGFLYRNQEIDSTARYDIVDLIAWARSASRLTEPLEQAALPPASDYIVSVPPEKIGSEPQLGGLGRLDVIPVDEGRDYYGRMTGLGIGSLERTELIRIGSLLRAWLKGRTFTESVPEYYGIPAPTHHYDFILIDSRTGVTEIGGLCIGPLSDNLVVLTALNDQNVNGTKQFLNEVGVLGNASGGRLDPKPTLIVASPVPAGEVNTKKERLKRLIEAVGPIVVKLSYHPQLALFETIFVRDYQDEYLTKEYLQLVELVSEFGCESESSIRLGELLSLSKDQQRDKIRPLLISRNRVQVAQLSVLSELFAEAVQDDKDDQLDADFALLDRWLLITARFDVQRANDSLRKRASLLMKWVGLTTDSNLGRLRFEAAQSAFAAIAESPKFTKDELSNCFLDWGNALVGLAQQKSGEEADRLFKLAGEKYEAAMRIKTDKHDALNNWGAALGAQAKQKSGEEADRLFKLAGEKYEAAMRIKPDKHDALNNWGAALGAQAKQKSGDEADCLFKLAGEKYEAALRIKPDKHEALNNWGAALGAQAQQKSGGEADRLFKLAGEKYEAALRIKPDKHEALNNWGAALGAQAKQKSGEEADRLFKLAGEKYEAALRIKLDKHDALNNWGAALSDQAKQKSGEEADRLFKLAGEKYEAALRINPDMHEALSNWGAALSAQAQQKSGEEADRLFKLAGEKYEAALRIKPDKHEALNNWGAALGAQAQQKSGDEADRLFKLAGEKYEAALRIKPDKHEALNNWGAALGAQAKQKSGEEADRLFKLAGEKYEAALRINPDMHEALSNWGAVLGAHAQQKSGDEADRLFKLAGEKLFESELLSPGSGAYNLACFSALQQQPEECRRWLFESLKHHTIPSKQHLLSDPDLESIRDLDWFTELLSQVPS